MVPPTLAKTLVCLARCPDTLCLLVSDDTPVALAKALPGEGAEPGGEEGEGSGANGRLWRTVIIGEQEHRIDMQVIRPYLRVVTHGGECGCQRQAHCRAIRERTGRGAQRISEHLL